VRKTNVKIVKLCIILLPRCNVLHVLKDVIFVLTLRPVILVVLVLYSEMENVTLNLVTLIPKNKFLIQLLDIITVNVLLIIPILMENVLGVLLIVDIVKMRLAVLSVTLEWLWNMIL